VPFTIAVSSRWGGKVEIGFGRRADRIEPPADVYLGVGFTAEMPGADCVGGLGIPAMNRELRVATLYDEPVDGTSVHNSADFTSAFAHHCHHSYPRCRFATVQTP
jgi:hypothetical protein